MLYRQGRNQWYNIKDYSIQQGKSYTLAQNFQSCSEAQCLLYLQCNKKNGFSETLSAETHWTQWENWVSSLAIMLLIAYLKYTTGFRM